MNRNVRVNILSSVNADSIKIERKGNMVTIKNYRWHIDGIVMNGGLYPKEENERSYMTMNGRLAPAQHPQINGQYIAISNLNNEAAAQALDKHYIGAYASNVRKEGENYFCDISINTKHAAANDDGKKVIEWIEKAEAYLAGNGEKPENLHTSTGLNTTRIQSNGSSRGKEYSWIATNQQYDHLALLPGVNGAGGDEISLAVNGEEEVEVLTCNLDEAINHTTGNKSNWTAMRKLVSFFAKNEEMSYEQIIDKLYYALRERFKVDDMWPYPCAVYDNYVVFSFGDEYRKIAYRIDLSDNVVLEGDYELVKKEVEFKPIDSREDDAMNELLLNALKEAGVDVNGLDTDDKVLAAYNEMMSKKAKVKEDEEDEENMDDKKDKAANAEIQAIVEKAVNAAVEPLKAQLNANSEAALKPKREAVMNKFDMTEEEVKALPEATLNKMYEKTKPINSLYSGQPQLNADETVCKRPE